MKRIISIITLVLIAGFCGCQSKIETLQTMDLQLGRVEAIFTSPDIVVGDILEVAPGETVYGVYRYIFITSDLGERSKRIPNPDNQTLDDYLNDESIYRLPVLLTFEIVFEGVQDGGLLFRKTYSSMIEDDLPPDEEYFVLLGTAIDLPQVKLELIEVSEQGLKIKTIVAVDLLEE